MIIQHTPWLFQSDAFAVERGEFRDHDIKAIASVCTQAPRPLCGFGEVSFLHVPFDDFGNDLTEEKLRTLSAFIDEHRVGGVLVCCFAGINRSSAIAAYALTTLGGSSSEQAIAQVRSRNPRARITIELLAVLSRLSGMDFTLGAQT